MRTEGEEEDEEEEDRGRVERITVTHGPSTKSDNFITILQYWETVCEMITLIAV